MRIRSVLRTLVVTLASLFGALVISVLFWLLFISLADVGGFGIFGGALVVIVVVFPVALGICWLLADGIAHKLASKEDERGSQPDGA